MVRDNAGRFAKGSSGNAKGRPAGRTAAAQLRAALTQVAPAVAKAMVRAALNGDVAAGKAILGATLPPLRAGDDAVNIEFPRGGLSAKAKGVLAAVEEGQIGTAQAVDLINAMAALARIVEVDELERRIEALEAARSSRRG